MYICIFGYIQESSSNRVEPSNASVDIIFHSSREDRSAESLVNYCPYRFGSVERGWGGGLAEERDDIITIINPEWRSLCQAVARGRILSTNAAHPRPGPTAFSPSACQPLLGDTVHARRRISVWLANFTTQEPGEEEEEEEVAARVWTGREGQTPEPEFVHTGLVRLVGFEQGMIIFGDRA